jgi:hypothetical protein
MDKELKKLYKKYNEVYFDNLLPNDVDLQYEIMPGYCGLSTPWEHRISIDPSLTMSQLCGTLLHEMIHFWQYFVEGKTEYNTQKEWHDIDFYLSAMYLHKLTGYEVA